MYRTAVSVNNFFQLRKQFRDIPHPYGQYLRRIDGWTQLRTGLYGVRSWLFRDHDVAHRNHEKPGCFSGVRRAVFFGGSERGASLGSKALSKKNFSPV